MIKVVGLGGGDISQISLSAYQTLKSSNNIYLRTKKHPIVDILDIDYSCFDDYYEHSEKFEDVYRGISEKIIEIGKTEDIVYAVPGHPRVAETTVSMIEDMAKKENIEIEIIPSMSFVDAMYNFLAIDPSDRFRLIDAFDIKKNDFDVDSNIIITQVYDRFIASNVKLKLMEYYSDDIGVWIVKSAGIKGDEYKKKIFLYELDSQENTFDHLTSLYIPKGSKKEFMDVYDLIRILNILRGEGGCPWDRAQDRNSLIKYMREELEEVVEAIEKDDIDSEIEELGDLLFHILFQCRIGEEEGFFNFEDITDSISRKMIRRHSGIFSKLDEYRDLIEPDFIGLDWESIKKSEKK